MIKHILSPALVVGLAVPLFLVLGWTSTAPPSTDDHPSVEAAVTGQIDAWRVTKNGSVIFRVNPRSADESGRGPKPRWFRVDAARDANNRPEVQILQVVLELGVQGTREGIVVTASGDANESHDGTNPSKAVPLTWVGTPDQGD
jgi:hypothetical protein